MTNVIQRATKIIKDLNVPFANSSDLLKIACKSNKRPIIFTTEACFKSQSLICDQNNNSKFIFSSEYDAGVEVEHAYETEFVNLHMLPKVPQERSTVTYRQIASQHLDDPLALAYLGHASQFLDQLHNVRYCTRCGQSLAGKSLCAHCQLQRYPRLSPCAMVLVHDQFADKILLVRKRNFNIWNSVAGFCEPLESMEQCAVREVMEETGIKLDEVSLAISQPWPFANHLFEGTSLMFGCFAQVSSPNQIPMPDGHEIEQAEWVDRSLVYQRNLVGPPSMGRMLIDSFLKAF
jgi:NADH pyrophosphatase NudC (nudix superfamily)